MIENLVEGLVSRIENVRLIIVEDVKAVPVRTGNKLVDLVHARVGLVIVNTLVGSQTVEREGSRECLLTKNRRAEH